MQTFELKKEHLKLLEKSCWDWDAGEYGAPAMNCKRPYGNSGRTQILKDMRKILGTTGAVCPNCDEQIDNSDEGYLDKLHQELKTALQIICVTQSFKLGVYQAEDYSNDWKLSATIHKS